MGIKGDLGFVFFVFCYLSLEVFFYALNTLHKLLGVHGFALLAGGWFGHFQLKARRAFFTQQECFK